MNVAILLLTLVLQGAGQQPPARPPAQAAPDAPHGGQAQPPAQQQPPPVVSRFAEAFPQHDKPDPAAIERGKTLWGANCTFCHGVDARGGSGGPSLIRSSIVLNDKNGEAIAKIVQNGVPDKMPAVPLSNAQVSDIAAFLHQFRVSGYDAARNRPISVVVGDAQAGEAAFRAKCASCHTITGDSAKSAAGGADLKGFSAKFTDPRAMQQNWLMPAPRNRELSVPPTTVTVTLASGQKIEGTLVRIDDFEVVVNSGGMHRTIVRDGNVPKVEVHDPLQPHKYLLPQYTDKDIHDITAYLVNLK